MIRAIGTGYALAVFGLMLMAVAAVLGFVHPSLDSFNHLQAFIFSGTLLGLVLAPFFVPRSRWQGLMVTIAATGFIASSAIVIPEAVARLKPAPPKPTDGRPVYTLMTHNVFGMNYEGARVLDALEVVDPDILTLQEYFPPQRRRLHAALAKKYPFFSVCTGGKRENIAIYSRLEFVGEKSGACEPGGDERRVSRIVGRFVGADGNPFTVVTTHLDWPAQISQLNKGENAWDGFNRAFARQRGQFDQLSNALAGIKGPLIVTADFNSTSWSYALSAFEHVAGLTRQDHFILTYPMQYWMFDDWRSTVPFLPLDHVMTRDGIITHAVAPGDAAGSDHRPLITVFSVEGRGLRLADTSQ